MLRHAFIKFSFDRVIKMNRKSKGRRATYGRKFSLLSILNALIGRNTNRVNRYFKQPSPSIILDAGPHPRNSSMINSNAIRLQHLCAVFCFSLFVIIVTSQAHAQATFDVTFDEPHIPLASATGTIIIDSEYETGGADNVNPAVPGTPGSTLPAGGGFSISTSSPGGTGESTVYNSTPGLGGADTDLEFSDSGNVLISQEETDNNGDNINGTGAVGDPPVNGQGDLSTFFAPPNNFITPDDVPGLSLIHI